MKKIFISFKKTTTEGRLTEDYEIATDLCSFLKKHGFSVFFSEFSLAESAVSNYKEQIDSALDTCDVLIVVGTSAQYINSPWVKYEWDTFLQDIISGIKPNADIFCVFKNIASNEIPRGLRYRQTFPTTAKGFTDLLNYLSKNQENPLNLSISVCKNCGEIFTQDTIGNCSYHPATPIPFTTKNFDGTVLKKWYFPCCGKEVEDDGSGTPQYSPGCKNGFHQK